MTTWNVEFTTAAAKQVRKLDQQMRLTRHLVAIEALVAAQAVDLRDGARLGTGTQQVFNAARSVVPMLQADRPSGPDAMAVQQVLFAPDLQTALRSVVAHRMGGHSLCGV